MKVFVEMSTNNNIYSRPDTQHIAVHKPAVRKDTHTHASAVSCDVIVTAD